MTRKKTNPRGADNQTKWRKGGWARFTLTTQFLIAGSIVLFIAMLLIGFWVTEQIEDGIARDKAASTAVYIESFIAPRVLELEHARRVSAQTQIALDGIFNSNEFQNRFVSFKIWKEAGLIAYSSHSFIIGTTYPVTEVLKNAWTGNVVAKFDSLRDKEDEVERTEGRSLLEIYSPIREPSTGKIIAVAEFYETADALVKILYQAKVKSWFAVAGATLLMMLTLSGIVMRGSRTIETQRHQLESRVEDLSVLLNQNEELRNRLQELSHRVAELNESNLRQIGASLHDGPAQLIGYALLLLDPLRTAFKNSSPGKNEPKEISSIETALGDAMNEIRELSAGLTLTKLEEMSPLMVLSEIVRAHERRTETDVSLYVDSIPDDLPLSQKISVFRFVQESLNNAYRQGDGVKQTVHCKFEGDYLEVKVTDGNLGVSQAAITCSKNDCELGLTELRDRIESLGATLKVASIPGQGTHLTMRCRVA